MRVSSLFSRMFTPPRFMTLPSAGVDISDASLKYVQFKHGGRRLELVTWGDIPIPEKTVKRGDLQNKDNLVAVLKEFKQKTRVEYVRVSLPEERAYLFETTVEKVSSPREIRNVLEFRLEENVPLSPRDAYFDYAVVGKNPTTHALTVGVAVYARDTINGYYEACRSAGLIPLSFEVEAQAIARAAVRSGERGAFMIVDFGQSRTGVGIVYHGTLMFTSTIDIGGAQLSDAMRRHIGAIEESEITRIKNTQGLLRSEEAGGEVYTALLSSIATLKDELSMRINYWNVHGEGVTDRGIEKIILCGGSVNLAGLPEYFTEELEIPTERAQVWQNAFSFQDVVPPITRRYSYGYATAIGLALTDFVPEL